MFKFCSSPNDLRFVPVITADCKLEEGYRFDPAMGPLKCPLVVLYGTKELVLGAVLFTSPQARSGLVVKEKEKSQFL